MQKYKKNEQKITISRIFDMINKGILLFSNIYIYKQTHYLYNNSYPISMIQG